FRHAFVVEDPAVLSNTVGRLLRDDGGVVYLNGVEIFRHNMPTGEVAYTTAALAAVEDDDVFYQANAGAGLLVSGTDVVAVEIHQSSGTSSDISFDLELSAS